MKIYKYVGGNWVAYGAEKSIVCSVIGTHYTSDADIVFHSGDVISLWMKVSPDEEVNTVFGNFELFVNEPVFVTV